MRVGIGYDSHRFSEGTRLILAGVTIPHDRGLEGHSDADAVAHAVTDALLGAAALGDIGTHFPSSEGRWRDADSMVLLGHVALLLQEVGLKPSNVDVTVICEAPRIGPHVEAMRARLAATLGMDARAVSVKAKTNEGMGWLGRGEGVAAMAIACVTG